MKKIQLIPCLLLILLFLGSCSKIKYEFKFGLHGYVVQKPGTEEVALYLEISPNARMQEASVIKGGNEIPVVISEWGIAETKLVYTSRENLNGEYFIKASDYQGNDFSTTFTLNISEESIMEEVKVDSFAYDSTGYLYASWEKLEDVDYYGYSIQIYNGYRFVGKTHVSSEYNNNYSLSIREFINEVEKGTTLKISFVAANDKSGFSVMQEVATKTLIVGEKKFRDY